MTEIETSGRHGSCSWWRGGLAALLLIGCGPAASASGGGAVPGGGGSTASGGTVGPGGAPGSGGHELGTGGTYASGGTPGSGGAPGTAGETGRGGSTSNEGPGSTGGARSGLAGNGGGAPQGTPGARIVGRTAPGTTGTRFEWSGSSVSARFMGTQISVQLNDANNGNSFEVIIDGGTPRKVFTTAAQTPLSLATGLTNGPHDIILWRDTEATYGPTEFIGFTSFGVGGGLLPPAPAPDRRIEIVGDSFSCGAGIEGGGATSCSPSIRVENHYLSYGAIAARAVEADLVTIAWSAIGVWRNYNTTMPNSTPTMPARYDYAIPTAATAWDFSKYQPHVVVMNLTNNDFSVGDPGQPYVDAYLALVKHIRAKYPSAYIMNVIEWATADTVMNQMVATLKAGGDTNVGAFDMRPFANRNACDHPDMPASQRMGDALAAEIRKVAGW